tara:strand:+ start:5569 stop:5862 length:294 start_codon:yes stop_codon:yes gene_type:complete
MKRKSYERNRRVIGQTHPKFDKRRQKMSIQISRADFIQYEVVKRSKKYKMHTPEARAQTSLTEAQWDKIHKHYNSFLPWLTNNKSDDDLISRMAERL